MEQMTARTILEAHTMRIIALVTLCFLPPTFIAVCSYYFSTNSNLGPNSKQGLLEMGYIDIALDSGHFTMNVEPGFFLYLIVTIPVVLLVVGGFLWWDWRSTKSAKTIGKSLV